jgi:hypothetical protein
MDIKSLLGEAFFTDDAKQATSAIGQARARVTEEGKVGAVSLEVVVPEQADESWLHERVLHPLIYFCQSTGSPPPECTGVFISFFYGDRVYCVLGAEVIAWAAGQLHVEAQELADSYGTGEREHPAPRAPA